MTPRYHTAGNAHSYRSDGYRDRPRISGGWQTRSRWLPVLGLTGLCAGLGGAVTLALIAMGVGS